MHARASVITVGAAVICAGALFVIGASIGDVMLASVAAITIDLALQARAMALGNADAEKRSVDIVWSTGSRVMRFDWLRDEQFIEESSVEPKHVRMERLRSGAPLLDSHMRHSLASQIGVVQRAER